MSYLCRRLSLFLTFSPLGIIANLSGKMVIAYPPEVTTFALSFKDEPGKV